MKSPVKSFTISVVATGSKLANSGEAEPAVNAIATDAQCVNQPLVIHGSGNGEFGGGNAANDLIVKVGYRVHASGF